MGKNCGKCGKESSSSSSCDCYRDSSSSKSSCLEGFKQAPNFVPQPVYLECPNPVCPPSSSSCSSSSSSSCSEETRQIQIREGRHKAIVVNVCDKCMLEQCKCKKKKKKDHCGKCRKNPCCCESSSTCSDSLDLDCSSSEDCGDCSNSSQSLSINGYNVDVKIANKVIPAPKCGDCKKKTCICERGGHQERRKGRVFEVGLCDKHLSPHAFDIKGKHCFHVRSITNKHVSKYDPCKDIVLRRGNTYIFSISVEIKSFVFTQSIRGGKDCPLVSNTRVYRGGETVIITANESFPSKFYYQCLEEEFMGGHIYVL